MSVRIRTGYSFRRAIGSIDEAVARIKQIKLAAAPITDTASTFGWVRWERAVRQAGLKPAFGVELAVKIGEGTRGRPIVDYWTFLAHESLAPLHKLIERSTEQFKYQPLLTLHQATEWDGVLKVVGSKTPLDQIEPRADLAVALSPSSAIGFLRNAERLGFPMIAASDNRYVTPDQQKLYQVICSYKDRNDNKLAPIEVYQQHLLSDDEWRQCVPAEYVDVALRNRDMWLDTASQVTLQRAEMVSPKITTSLRAMCSIGARERNIDLGDPRYAQRLDHELTVIKEKKFEDYFYVVADIVAWARRRMLVGPARGSSCGSLVCYLLGITTVDPLKFDLLFERFIDISRDDLPDIDIDFSERHRDEVFEYLRRTYGPTRVARIGTVNTFGARAALQEIARLLKVPPWEFDSIAEAAQEEGIARALADAPASLKYRAEIELAAQIEGRVRHAGAHAAGVVITAQNVSNTVAFDWHAETTMCDMADAAALGMVKIDALGLTQLTIFEDALEMARLDRKHLESIPLDDPKAFAVLNEHKFAGIFQFQGRAVQSISEAIKIGSIDDLIAITSLARPGPLNSGAAKAFVEHRRGGTRDQLLGDLLTDTFGVIVYQEQVMKLCRDLAHMEWRDINNLRRVIAKTQGVEALEKFREMFCQGVRDHNRIADSEIENIWSHIVTFGGYGFNKSHAAAYSVITYWCCWMKAYHPVEYAAAVLSHTSEDQQMTMLREIAKEGIKFVPADRYLSTDRWTVSKGALLGPLTNIVGIGPTHCTYIMAQRRRGDPINGPAAKALGKMEFKIGSLFPFKERLKVVLPDLRERNITTEPTEIANVQANGARYDVMVLGVVNSLRVKNVNDAAAVARRGSKLDGPQSALNIQLGDDGDTILARVSQYDFDAFAPSIIERGAGAIYAVIGTVPPDFRMIAVKRIKFIGTM